VWELLDGVWCVCLGEELDCLVMLNGSGLFPFYGGLVGGGGGCGEGGMGGG